MGGPDVRGRADHQRRSHPLGAVHGGAFPVMRRPVDVETALPYLALAVVLAGADRGDGVVGQLPCRCADFSLDEVVALESKVEIVEAVPPALAGEVVHVSRVNVEEEHRFGVLRGALLLLVDEAVPDEVHIPVGADCRRVVSEQPGPVVAVEHAQVSAVKTVEDPLPVGGVKGHPQSRADFHGVLRAAKRLEYAGCRRAYREVDAPLFEVSGRWVAVVGMMR